MHRPILLTSLTVALSLVSLFKGTAALAQPDPATNERTETEPYGAILVAPLTEYQQSNFREAYKAFGKIAAASSSNLKSLTAMDRVLALAGAGASAYQNYHYNEALSCFSEATRLLNTLKIKNHQLYAELICSQGEVLYELDHFKDSEHKFEEAINCWKEGKASYAVLMRSLEGLAACYTNDKKPAQARPVYEEIAWRDRIAYGDTSVPYGWSLRILSDTLKDLGESKKSDICFERSVWNFRNSNRDRVVNELQGQSKYSHNELYKRLTERIVGKLTFQAEPDFLSPAYTHIDSAAQKPASANTERTLPWARARLVAETPAAKVWVDTDATPRGVVVCVPGFGLHRGSFAALGTNLAHQGYIVYSYDVRGFGSYEEMKARDTIDLFRTLDDLDESIKKLRVDYPNLPIFILGESMGGSVALQFTAFHPDLIDGLIASVPSANRYPQWKAATKVAIELFTHNSEPVDVETYVVNRATKDSELKQNLAQDPDGRFSASPREFLSYSKFLRRNYLCARMIKHTPVLMFQGVHDLLIRPEGTIRLFRLIGTEDKDLVLVGKTQHLLFEQGQFDNNIMNNITDWMRNHSPNLTTNESSKSNQIHEHN